MRVRLGRRGCCSILWTSMLCWKELQDYGYAGEPLSVYNWVSLSYAIFNYVCQAELTIELSCNRHSVPCLGALLPHPLACSTRRQVVPELTPFWKTSRPKSSHPHLLRKT